MSQLSLGFVTYFASLINFCGRAAIRFPEVSLRDGVSRGPYNPSVKWKSFAKKKSFTSLFQETALLISAHLLISVTHHPFSVLTRLSLYPPPYLLRIVSRSDFLASSLSLPEGGRFLHFCFGERVTAGKRVIFKVYEEGPTRSSFLSLAPLFFVSPLFISCCLIPFSPPSHLSVLSGWKKSERERVVSLDEILPGRGREEKPGNDDSSPLFCLAKSGRTKDAGGKEKGNQNLSSRR